MPEGDKEDEGRKGKRLFMPTDVDRALNSSDLSPDPDLRYENKHGKYVDQHESVMGRPSQFTPDRC